MSNLFVLPRQTPLNSSGLTYPGAKAYFFETGSNTPKDVYQNAGLSVAHPVPVVADSGGRMPAIFLDTSSGEYRLTLNTSADALIYTQDNVGATGLSQAGFDDLLEGSPPYERTLAEINASVTPSDYAFPPLSVERYGADPTGVADSTAAFNRAFLVGKTLGNAMVFTQSCGTFKITGALTIDTNLVGFEGRGCVLSCSTMSSGTVWTPTQSISDVNRRPHYNNAHPIRDFVMIGPGGGNTATIPVYLQDLSSQTIAGLVFENIGFLGFGTDVYFGTGSFFTTFKCCSFAPGTGLAGGAVYSIVQDPLASNTGERQTFISCQWFNKSYVISQGANADIQLYGCSIDLGSVVADPAIVVTGGQLFIHGGHIELISGDLGYIATVSGTNSAIILTGTEIILQANRSSFGLFSSDSGCTNGGIVLLGCSLQYASTLSTRIVDGTGAALIKNLRVQGNVGRPALSSHTSLMAYGTFESASYANDWTLTNGATRSNTQAHAGTWSLSFPSVSGTAANALATRRCEPGQMLSGELWYRIDNIATTGGTFFVELRFTDAAGGTISGTTVITVTADTVGWVKLPFSQLTPAPTGTVNCQLNIGAFGIASGTLQAYVDDVILNLG